MKTPTPEELNVTILEWIGWTDFLIGFNGELYAKPNPDCVRVCIPNLSEDLNACSQAEDNLNPKQWNEYCLLLEKTNPDEVLPLWRDMNTSIYLTGILIHLSALQRLTALCRVVKPSLFDE
jgi:hypothetical protein